MTTTRELVEKIRSGDGEAFREIVEEYKRLVYHVVFRLVSHATDREDVCQDIFVKVYQNLSSFQFESKISTWIGKIAYNTCLNYLKKKKVPLFDDTVANVESMESYVNEDSALEDDITHRDMSSRMQNEIAKLPAQYRSILTLYHLEGLKYVEIAEIMNLPEGTVKSYLFRARKALKNKLTANYTLEELCL